MQHRRIDFLPPVEAAARLRRLGGLAFLDSAMAHAELGRYAYVAASPFARFSVDAAGASLDGSALAGPPLEALRGVLSRFALEPVPGLPPFQGGAVGFIAYDFAHHLEHVAAPADFDPAKPMLRFDLYDTVIAFDLAERAAWLISSGFPEADQGTREARSRARIAAFEAVLQAPAEPSGLDAAPLVRRDAWRADVTAEQYTAAIERVKSYILDGDIYQANIAQGFTAELPGGFDAFAFYRRLRDSNPAPFAAFLDYGDLAIASSSPERFLKLSGGAVETRPIKGTAPRHADPAADRDSADALLASAKDRAENVMIVDLLRNDLSRVSEPASVEVSVLCGLESYASVHHLVSVVTSRLAPGCDALDLVAATFPGGSITGAPKLRAMDIITEIEGKARGPYCGSIGYIGFDGSMDLNIAIRTVTLAGGQARLQAGGGITILSEPEGEYAESLTKAGRIFAAFAGETAS
ncbi:aminodeoxychorismate synthase component I [Mangrovicella endophytica]|uniref:aminodeoxychorismate synthase component I n=1 Tax=Mangrovicella endophytica TaxID=2066697 RepID=UPI000C9DADC5|nr:aminodeoxychorismate synthase component I [Mangrovicella endophytica]